MKHRQDISPKDLSSGYAGQVGVTPFVTFLKTQ